MEPPGGKEKLSFLEKTQAQKRLLLNVFTAKSKLETRQPTLFNIAASVLSQSPSGNYKLRTITIWVAN